MLPMRTATISCPRFPFKMTEQIDLLEFGQCRNCYHILSALTFGNVGLNLCLYFLLSIYAFPFCINVGCCCYCCRVFCSCLPDWLFNFRISVPNFPLRQQNHSRGGTRGLLWQQHQTHSRRGGLQPLPMPCFVRYYNLSEISQYHWDLACQGGYSK